MLPLFNLCVNKRTSSMHSHFLRHAGHISCQTHTNSGSEGSAPSHRSPWSPDAPACLIVKNAGDKIQLYKKALGANGPHSIGGSLVGLHLSIKNVDAAAQKAIQPGAENPVPSLSDYQRSCQETMRRKATGCVSQERGIKRRSCLAKI